MHHIAKSVLPLLAALGAATLSAAATRQQMFDAAQAAFDKEDWPAAIAGFEPLLADERHPGRVDGIIRDRYAISLFMAGRAEEAETQAQRAVGEFPDGKDEQRASAFLDLARIEATALDMRGALDAYTKVRAALPADTPLLFEIDLSEAGAATVVDPARALRLTTAAIESPRFAALPKVQQAQIVAAQARAQLNSGDPKRAIPIIRRAIVLSGGGETTKINTIQASIRSDAALILLRSGQEDEARKVLAYSGSGYMPDSGWLNATDNPPPVCDEAVRPDDVAVVEFTVSDNGDVSTAQPVYASRPGDMGLMFAQRVLQWHFDPDSFKSVNRFWRTHLRLELRCITRPASLALSSSLYEESREWLMANATRVADPTALHVVAGAMMPPSRTSARVADRSSKRGSPTSVEIAAALAAAGAPPALQALLEYQALGHGANRIAGAPRRAQQLAVLVARFQSMPNAARATAWLEVETAMELETAGDFAGAKPFLEHAVAVPADAMDEQDPIRLVATLHLSLVERQLGAATAADERLRKGGLDAEQCALFDVKPVPLVQKATSSDFPAEAARWRMEGFAQAAFDIEADGKVARVRTIKAYPPFVFSAGTERIIQRFRYLPPTLNNVVLGCSAETMMFRFRVPQR